MEDWPLRSPIDATSDSVEKFSNAVTRVLRIRPIRSTIKLAKCINTGFTSHTTSGMHFKYQA
ncbi:predicted protein [Sclerotinia sclerotiorum 1980 UF-70]|uniref:Uncharacterized protein n=1 Tax=Sclerotinia sclerotiorum (strain ATCC 18683 / 1980 / Ss-1) TaxID=665079 RepID=A7ECL7_SCLS1|nr:predicted protein [Sclerotinia sclerotiorum 1980 UF-70]EDO00196.1 predicted protein [Sclerotinia sclerotiorum 1980 UF-70]